MNGTKILTQQNLQDAATVVLRNVYLLMPTFKKKRMIIKRSNGSLQEDNIVEQNKPKASRIKITVAINERVNRKTMKKINKTKIWFFKNYLTNC